MQHLENGTVCTYKGSVKVIGDTCKLPIAFYSNEVLCYTVSAV